MAGGPVQGTNIDGKPVGVIIPTTIQISSDLLSYLTSMTCLFDPFWVPEVARATLPITVFHITGIQEVSSSQVQKKRIMLYEPQAQNLAAVQSETVRESVLRTIVDNVVREPKVYTINAVLPFKTLGRYVKEGTQLISDTIAMFVSQLSGGDSLKSIYGYAGQTMKYMEFAMDALSRLPSMQDITQINKYSIDAMHERSHLLCMKMWTGFDYRYVSIVNMTLDKRPQEDDNYRLTMQVQEMPVLSLGATSDRKLGNPYSLSLTNSMAVAQRMLTRPLTAALMTTEYSKSVWGGA